MIRRWVSYWRAVLFTFLLLVYFVLLLICLSGMINQRKIRRTSKMIIGATIFTTVLNGMRSYGFPLIVIRSTRNAPVRVAWGRWEGGRGDERGAGGFGDLDTGFTRLLALLDPMTRWRGRWGAIGWLNWTMFHQPLKAAGKDRKNEWEEECREVANSAQSKINTYK